MKIKLWTLALQAQSWISIYRCDLHLVHLVHLVLIDRTWHV